MIGSGPSGEFRWITFANAFHEDFVRCADEGSLLRKADLFLDVEKEVVSAGLFFQGYVVGHVGGFGSRAR